MTPRTHLAVRIACTLLLVGWSLGTVAGTNASDTLEAETATGTPHVVALYPNPTLQDDLGEFVTVVFPDETPLGRCALADDEASVSLP